METMRFKEEETPFERLPFAFGERVVHVESGKTAIVAGYDLRRGMIALVRWSHTGWADYRRADELKSLAPIPVNPQPVFVPKKRSWGKDKTEQKQRLKEENLARDLAKLHGKHTQRNTNKARTMMDAWKHTKP